MVDHRNIFSKILVIIVLLLFIGLAATPGINAQNDLKTEQKFLIDYYYGRERKSISVTREQLEKIDSIIEKYNEKPSNDRDFILLFDKINDIAVFNKKDYQQIKQYFSNLQNYKNRFNNRFPNQHQPNRNRNSFCSVVATMETYWGYYDYGFITSIPPIGLLLYLIPFMFMFFGDYYHFWNLQIPFQLLGMVFFGSSYFQTFYPKGKVTTSGINGEITSEGYLLGNIPIKKFYGFTYEFEFITLHVALIGFSGLRIPNTEVYENDFIIKGHHLVGFSLYADFEEVYIP
jgi:hypothetical protein